MIYLANRPDLNLIENLWWKFKRMVHKKVSSTIENLLTAIQVSWNYFE